MFFDKKPAKKFGSSEFPKKNTFSSSDSYGKPVSHKATCADCGKSCEVPFKPNGKKPVLCSKCFNKDGTAYASKPWEKDATRPASERNMHPATCSRCSAACEVPFRPIEGRQIFCTNCLGHNKDALKSASAPAGNSDVAEELKKMNAKLDAMLIVLTKHMPTDNIDQIKF